MPKYFVWIKHGERGVLMEDDKEEDDTIPDWTQEGAVADEPMKEDYNEIGENQGADNALDEVLREAKEDCGEKVRSQRNLNVC
jgi:hypothetical protein